MSANVRNRHSIKVIYSLEQFETDANQNSLATATTRNGLLIESAPGQDGSFLLRRMTMSVSGGHEGPEALFICPYMGKAYERFALLDGSMGLAGEKVDFLDLELHEYDVFIDAIIAMAQTFTPPRRPHMTPLG